MEYRLSEWAELINTAEKDLQQAKANLKDKLYEWSYLKAKLAAEGAIKALISYRGGNSRAKSLTSLLKDLEALQPVEPQMYEFARFLEADFQLATESISQAGIIQAEKIFAWAQDQIK